MYKKQFFDNQELAMFFQVFGKNLVTRPKQGEVYSIDGNDGCTFFFEKDFYDSLKADMIEANDLGKFDNSNAASDWKSLLSKVLRSADVDKIPETGAKDYFNAVNMFWR